jgi:hypothetical protein
MYPPHIAAYFIRKNTRRERNGFQILWPILRTLNARKIYAYITAIKNDNTEQVGVLSCMEEKAIK